MPDSSERPERITDHFTSADRERLITTKVNLENLTASFADMRRSMDAQRRGDEEHAERMEERVRALENFRWWILGASAASGAFFGMIGRFFHT